MKLTTPIIVLGSIAAAPQAMAFSAALFDSQTIAYISVSNPSAITYTDSGIYTTLSTDPVSGVTGLGTGEYFPVPIIAAGDGENSYLPPMEGIGLHAITLETATESLSANDGYAQTGEGFQVEIDFTNTSKFTQYFGVTEYSYQDVQYTGYAGAQGYGGFEEFGNSYAYGYSSLYLSPAGPGQYQYGNNDFYYGGLGSPDVVSPYEVSYQWSDGFIDSIAPGQTVPVVVWSSGATFASTVPAPAAAIAFGINGLISRRRRRRG